MAYNNAFEQANQLTALKPRSCPHCGMSHDTTCPRVRAIEYHQDGTVKRIEFHTYAPVVSGHDFLAGTR